MLIYLLLGTIPMILGLVNPCLNYDNRYKIRYMLTCGVIITIILGLRDPSLGSTDTQNYIYMFKSAISCENWSDFFSVDSVEYGFQYFLWVLSRVFENPQMLLVITSAIYISSVFYYIYKNSLNITMSIVLYVTICGMFFQLQGMRQAVAMSICLYAYELLMKEKNIRFFILMGIAYLFHQTAIVFIVVFVISKLKFKISHILLVMCALFLFLEISDRVVYIANTIFEKNYGLAAQGGGFVNVIVYFIVIFLALLYERHIYYSNLRERTGFFMLLIGCACYVMRYLAALAAERISFYFIFSQLIILPNSIESISDERDRRLVKFFMYSLTFALFIYRLNKSPFYPFKFFGGF